MINVFALAMHCHINIEEWLAIVRGQLVVLREMKAIVTINNNRTLISSN